MRVAFVGVRVKMSETDGERERMRVKQGAKKTACF
jgi:hypothetical protein